MIYHISLRTPHIGLVSHVRRYEEFQSKRASGYFGQNQQYLRLLQFICNEPTWPAVRHCPATRDINAILHVNVIGIEDLATPARLNEVVTTQNETPAEQVSFPEPSPVFKFSK